MGYSRGVGWTIESRNDKAPRTPAGRLLRKTTGLRGVSPLDHNVPKHQDAPLSINQTLIA
jgi:hypothetical protein